MENNEIIIPARTKSIFKSASTFVKSLSWPKKKIILFLKLKEIMVK